MKVKQLEFCNFRNLEGSALSFTDEVQIIHGQNGHGKTNLIEALYVLSKGKSFRTSTIEHLQQHSAQGSSKLKCLIEADGIDHNIEFIIEKGKKRILLNGKPTRSTNVFKKFPLILFSPESLTAIKDGPEERRNLLDETAFLENAKNLNTLNDFKKCLRSRNKILKDVQSEKMAVNQAKKILEALDPSYLDLCAQVTFSRVKMLTQLTPLMNSIMKDISNRPDVETSVEYVIKENPIGENITINDIFSLLSQKLDLYKERQWHIGFTPVGPHKHEVNFKYDNQDSRFFCSQGQQRALILAFKFAQIVRHNQIYGFYPIVLLDDVLSELDREKREYLVNFLKQSEAQTFITTTEYETQKNLEKLSLNLLHISHGKIAFENNAK